MLETTKTILEDKVVVYLKGRLDTNTSKQLEADINEIFNEKEIIMISFKELDYISSAGLRVILSFYKKSTSVKKQFILSEMNPLVKEVFDISGFTKFLTIV